MRDVRQGVGDVTTESRGELRSPRGIGYALLTRPFLMVLCRNPGGLPSLDLGFDDIGRMPPFATVTDCENDDPLGINAVDDSVLAM